MKRNFEVIVDQKNTGKRIDKFLSEIANDFGITLTRSSAEKLFCDQKVFVNKKNVLKSYKLSLGDIVNFIEPEVKSSTLVAQNIPIEIVYEDDDLLVVNKSQGMVVHPGCGNPDRTLVNALLFHCKESLSKISGKSRLGIVHRIDKNTSGLLIIAKNDNTHVELAKQIKEHSFLREYEAIVHKNFKKTSGKIEAPIGRDPKNRKRMAVINKSSKDAITYYEVLKNLNNFSHIKLKLKTGRTHQIRVHMAKIGHPVAGDFTYGSKINSFELKGQCLHAKTISFIHPKNNKKLLFESNLPRYFSSFLKKIECKEV